MKLDLNDEEFDECLKAYSEEFRSSNKGPAAELTLRIRLKAIGLDRDEIDLTVSELKRR